MQLPLDQWTMAKQLALWPIEEWPMGWLRFKIAMLLHKPDYLHMTDAERRAYRMPVSRQQMLDFIKIRNG